MIIKAHALLLAGLLLLLSGGSSVAESGDGNGYRAVTGYGEGFVAAGSDGRIDRIDRKGRIVHTEPFPGIGWNCLLTRGTTLFAAGEAGMFGVARDGADLRPVESGTTLNIRALTAFQNYLVAACGGGTVLIGDEAGFFEEVPLDVRGNIVSLSAGTEVCYGVTDRGEIFHSRDLVGWTVFDFNAVYAGYYESCRWTAVVVTDEQIAAAGSDESGRPVLFFSTGGVVWTPRNLDYTDPQGMPAHLEERPNAMLYDAVGDRFVLACNEGTVMIVPACSHCNERHDWGAEHDLTAIAIYNNTLIFTGVNHYVGTTDLR